MRKNKRIGKFSLGMSDGEMIGIVLTRMKFAHHQSRHRALWVRFREHRAPTIRLAERWHQKDQREMSIEDAKELRRLLNAAIRTAEEGRDS